jgi:hypothetical protein
MRQLGIVRLSQNFSFGKATLDLWEKAGFRPLFQEVFPNQQGFGKTSRNIHKKGINFTRWSCFFSFPLKQNTRPFHIEAIKGEKILMDKKDTPRDKPIDWHAAFREGIQLALYPYRDSLRFEFEHPLNSQPLRIDAIILKEKQETTIDNPIGEILRNVNILEYKSPGDYLSIIDFYKVDAYASLYCAQNGTKATDMSVSFVSEAYPRKLFDYLKKEHGIEALEQRPGIYCLAGAFFPTQVIETKRLEETGGGIWLKDLRRGLNGKQLREIIDLTRTMPEGSPLSAFLHTLFQANSLGLEEMIAMAEASYEAVLEKYGLTAKWEAKGLEKGLEMGWEKAVCRMQKHGMGPGQIAEVLELPLETVFRYLQLQ